MLFAALIYYDSLVERPIIRAIVFSTPLVNSTGQPHDLPTTEVRRFVRWTRRPGASQLCRSGIPSKANFSVCHSQQLYHTLHTLLETQSLLTN